MWKAVEKLRLREVYQPLAEPVREAREAAMTSSANARVLRWIMGSSLGRDDGNPDRIPLLGDKQEL
jgi:hypothetical protein